MRNRTVSLVLVATAVLLGGCRSKITSSLTVNGATFNPTTCRNGEALGFSGVELSDAAGTRVRITSTPMGQGMVYLFPGAGASAMMMGLCGPFSVERQSSQINSIYNVRGNATLNCNGMGGTIAGSVSFENCH